MKKSTILLLLFALWSIRMLAIPAHPGVLPMPQPDGTMVNVQLVGDEYYHFNTTADGYTVVLNEAGGYVYAQREGGKLKATTILAHNEGSRSAAELALLASTPKYLVDELDVNQGNARRAKRNVDFPVFNLADLRGLVILVNFSDVKFNVSDPDAFYTAMFGTEGFTGFFDPLRNRDVSCPGGVMDYFRDQSNGAFVPPFDVYGPYNSAYKARQANSNSAAIFNAILSAANSEIDFRNYDSNNDGKIDMIYFLVAGYSSSYQGNNTGYLWPHASSLAWSFHSYDGKWADRYACSTEIYGYEGSTCGIEGIGTICHEFSHVLGLPDLYDTDYADNGGESNHPGEWDLMAGGSHFNYGCNPVGYSLYELYTLGWAHPQTITETGEYTLNPVNTSREGYLLRTPEPNEYFAIENRQRTGWDSYLPGHGMLVTRVDSTNASIWTNNKVNCYPAHNYYEILRAGNNNSGNSSSDPFPGSSGNIMITNESTPSLVTWGGLGNIYNIVGISENDGIINFKVVEEGSLQTIVEDFEGMPVSSGTTDQNVEGAFASWSFNKSGVRAPGEEKANGENSVMMKLPSQFFSTTPIYYNIYQAALTVFNPASSVAKYTLDYSLDGGATWNRVLSATGNETAEVAAKSKSICYWTLDLANNQPAQFRISQSGGNKNVATYVDDFTLYYNGEEGGPDQGKKGDVNGDGEVNIADVNAVISIILGGFADDNIRKNADVNGDGEINIADVNAVISCILNI